MDNKGRPLLFLILFISCIFLFCGCDSLRKKFTRVKKKTDAEEDIIVSPRDYSLNPYPPEVIYKQYFVYWKSWNQELVTSLNDMSPNKKILVCVREAIKNLNNMAAYLSEDKRAGLRAYIKKSEDLEEEIKNHANLTPSSLRMLKYKAERILSAVNRNYDVKKMSLYLRQKGAAEIDAQGVK